MGIHGYSWVKSSALSAQITIPQLNESIIPIIIFFFDAFCLTIFGTPCTDLFGVLLRELRRRLASRCPNCVLVLFKIAFPCCTTLFGVVIAFGGLRFFFPISGAPLSCIFSGVRSHNQSLSFLILYPIVPQKIGVVKGI